MRSKDTAVKNKPNALSAVPVGLLTELRELIRSGRSQVAQAVNAGMTMLYWQVGDRIRRETLREKRAKYGAEIVSTLGRQLEQELGTPVPAGKKKGLK